MDERFFVGLISGTSADGVDAVIARFAPTLEIIDRSVCPYSESLRARVLSLARTDAAISLSEFGLLDAELGEHFADAAQRLIERSGIDRSRIGAIGSHGQTIYHAPDARVPFTLQIGDPNRIAERCAVPVVADFRRRDVSAGGQGAPLVPAFHAERFSDPSEDRAVLNLGGIANLSLLPASGTVRGFDTGPASCLMDAWCMRQFGIGYDEGGAVAAQGRIHARELARMLADPYFALPAPKSTGREYFDLAWLNCALDPTSSMRDEDMLSTLAELTVESISRALERELPSARRLLICGGGVHNQHLMARLRLRLPEWTLESTAAYGLDPDYVEATAFAWLAWRRVNGLPGNLPAVTGARGSRSLGCIVT